MIKLNDYLYSGDTIFRILDKYIADLRKEAKRTHNAIDLTHCNFLLQIRGLLEHNDFLTAQSQQIREFYKYMAKEYPFLAFTFKGRIKSLIRAEAKFNGYIVEYIYDYYVERGTYPSVSEIKDRLSCFRDFIAYRIVISMPKCHYPNEEKRKAEELKCLYEIAKHSREAGNTPFGALLVDAEGNILMEQENVEISTHKATGHAETQLIERASMKYSKEFLWNCTLYTTAEPCAMCAGAMYWANIGTVVYAMTEKDLLALTGSDEQNPTFDLPCREVFARGQKDITVIGPFPELAPKAAEVHKGYWNN